MRDCWASEMKRLKTLKKENSRLKRMYAELALDHHLAKEIIEKSQNPARSVPYSRNIKNNTALAGCAEYLIVPVPCSITSLRRRMTWR